MKQPLISVVYEALFLFKNKAKLLSSHTTTILIIPKTKTNHTQETLSVPTLLPCVIFESKLLQSESFECGLE